MRSCHLSIRKDRLGWETSLAPVAQHCKPVVGGLSSVVERLLCTATVRRGAYPTTIGQRLATDLPVLNSSNTKILTSHASFERICGLSGPRSYQKTDCWRVHRDQERACR